MISLSGPSPSRSANDRKAPDSRSTVDSITETPSPALNLQNESSEAIVFTRWDGEETSTMKSDIAQIILSSCSQTNSELLELERECWKPSLWGPSPRHEEPVFSQSLYAALLDQLIELQVVVGLSDRTLFLSIALFHQAAGHQKLSPSSMLGLGLAALQAASKIEESVQISANLASAITAFRVPTKKLGKFEGRVLEAAEFRLIRDSPISILGIVDRMVGLDPRTLSFASLSLFVSLYDWRIQRFSMQTLVLASLSLSHTMINSPDHRQALQSLPVFETSPVSVKICACLLEQGIRGLGRAEFFALRKKFGLE